MEKQTEENEKVDINGEVLYESFNKGNKRYGFSLRKTRNNEMYIVITEREKEEEGMTGKPKFKSHKIRVYEESLEIFVSKLMALSGMVTKFVNERDNSSKTFKQHSGVSNGH